MKKDESGKFLSLNKPQLSPSQTLEKTTYTVAERKTTYHVLQQVGDTVEVSMGAETTDLYSAAVELSAVFRLDLWAVYDELRRVYGDETEIPVHHLEDLAQQIENQTRNYQIVEETREVALALVKPDGFEKAISEDGTEVYTAEITYPIDREKLLVHWEEWKDFAGNFGFHYTPYNFDSSPEKSFLEQLLTHLKLHPSEVEDIYFTGALTDTDKTDFHVEYKGEDSKWHPYTPDFIIRRKDGRSLIVEIKDARFENATEEDLRRSRRGEEAITVEGRKAIALQKWEDLNPDQLKYQLVFARSDEIGYDQTKEARDFVEGE